MVKSAETGEYFVAGLNTWKAAYRENANFAIPGQYIIDFVENYKKSSVELSDAQLRKRASDFIKDKGSYKNITSFLSYEYMGDISPLDFKDWFRNRPRDVRELIIDHFNQSNPIEGVRIAMAYDISSKMLDKQMRVVSVKGNTVTMQFGKKQATSEWVKEQGVLRVKRLSFFKTTTYGKNGLARDFHYTKSLKFGVWTTFSDIKNTYMFNLAYSRAIKTFGTLDVIIKYGILPPYMAQTEGGSYVEVTSKPVFGVDYSMGVQVPIKLGPIYLIPYAKPFLGGSIRDRLVIDYGVRGGMEFGYHLSSRSYLLLGVGYKYTGYLGWGAKSNMMSTNGLESYIGITF